MNKNKSKKGFKTMFKNINLKKLTQSELDLLLRLVDLYASEFNNEVISDELKEKLNQYGDEICTYFNK
tara:strand:- start:50 stop:253 length:204 start_codon:yes stop_codon:yes gene_type:complete